MKIKNKKQWQQYLLSELKGPELSKWSGAPLYGINYQDQLAAKHNALLSLMQGIVPADILTSYEIAPSPQLREYRVKMEYLFTADYLGQRVYGDFRQTMTGKNSPLFSNDVFSQLEQLHKLALELGADPFDVTTNSGWMRYFVPKFLDEDNLMLSFVTTSNENSELIDKLANKALELGFSSVHWLVNDSGQDSTAGKVEMSWGKPLVEMHINDCKYLVGPHTFTQNNLAGFEPILKYVNPYLQQGEKLLDLYCGVGVIGIEAAKYVKHATGVEVVAESIDLARRNAEINQIENADFIVDRVSAALHRQDLIEYSYYKHSDLSTRYRTDNPHIDTVVVDPARPGLEGKVCRRLQKYFNTDQIIYISCNPISQLIDLQNLTDTYQIKAMRGFDLFPHTYHLENVAILKRR